MGITHRKVLVAPDNGNSGQVQPSDWNNGHDLTGLLALLDAVIPSSNTVLTFDISGNPELLAKAMILTGLNATLSGVPTAPTAAPGTNTTQIATTAFVRAAVTALINSAPGALDTLDELAAALGDDANFAATVTAALAAKAALASPTFTGTPAVPSAANTVKTTQAASMAAAYAIIGCRGQCSLSKVSTNLVLTPKDGNLLTVNGINCTVPDAGISLAATSLTPGTLYYIYAVATAGAISSLEASTTVPVADTTAGNKGVMIKTGDATRTLVGMARPITGPAWQDTQAQRFVRSWYNDSGVDILGAATTATTTSATIVEIASSARSEFLVWASELICAQMAGTLTDTAAGASEIGMGLDGTTAASDHQMVQVITTGTRHGFSVPYVSRALSEGYHYLTPVGRNITATTCSFNVANGARVIGTIGPRVGG